MGTRGNTNLIYPNENPILLPPLSMQARSSSGLTFLQVIDGGHMVPADQPEVSLTMLKTFLSNGKF